MGKRRMVVGLWPHNLYARTGCDACGRASDSNGVAAQILDEQDPASGGIEICMSCLAIGQAETAQRMLSRAEQLEQWAQALRQSAGEVEQMGAEQWPEPVLAQLAVLHLHEALGRYVEEGGLEIVDSLSDPCPGADLDLGLPNGARAYSPEALEALRPALERAAALADNARQRAAWAAGEWPMGDGPPEQPTVVDEAERLLGIGKSPPSEPVPMAEAHSRLSLTDRQADRLRVYIVQQLHEQMAQAAQRHDELDKAGSHREAGWHLQRMADHQQLAEDLILRPDAELMETALGWLQRSRDEAERLLGIRQRRDKADKLSHYASKPASRFWQWDGFSDVEPGDYVMIADEDRDCLMGGQTVELMSSRPEVRVLVPVGTGKADVLRLLDKIRSWVDETDWAEMQWSEPDRSGQTITDDDLPF